MDDAYKILQQSNICVLGIIWAAEQLFKSVWTVLFTAYTCRTGVELTYFLRCFAESGGAPCKRSDDTLICLQRAFARFLIYL